MIRKDDVLSLLGLDIDQPFLVTEWVGYVYKIDEKFHLYSKPVEGNQSWSKSRIHFRELFLYDLTIIPCVIDIDDKGVSVINYARACGYKYLAKDKDGCVHAYKECPVKMIEQGCWARGGDCFYIHCDCDFLSWNSSVAFDLSQDWSGCYVCK